MNGVSFHPNEPLVAISCGERIHENNLDDDDNDNDKDNDKDKNKDKDNDNNVEMQKNNQQQTTNNNEQIPFTSKKFGVLKF